ncbi:peptidylprolyl isomerase [Endomicrobium sp. AH-315-J14]|nr:peptidylprolyl isomerase [Endomicrobium sp. AH-315-J14]
MPKAIKQIFVIIAVVAISMVFVLEFRPGAKVQSTNAPRCAVEIGSECIGWTDYIAAYRLVVPRGADSDQLKQLSIRKFVVEGLIESWLLNEDAKRLGLSASEDDVTAELSKGRGRVSLPAHMEDKLAFYLGVTDGIRGLDVVNPKTQKFDYKRYERTIRATTNKTPSDFRDYQRKELLAARMRNLVKARVRISEKEAHAQYAREEERVVVKYVKLEGRFYAKWAVDPSDDAKKAWAEGHKAELDAAWEGQKSNYMPECRQARHILIKVDPTAKDTKKAAEDARKKIDAAIDRIGDGESFAEVAAELSEDPGSARNGGDLGCFTKGKMTKPFEEAVFALEEGQLSEVVTSTFGLHLIKLDKIYKEDDAEALGRGKIIEELYERQESARLAAEGAKQILAAVRGGKSFEDAIAAHLDAVLLKSDDDKKKKKDDEDDDPAPSAATDPNRPRIQTSAPFSALEAPFPGVKNPSRAAAELFALKKGELPKDTLELYTGAAVAQLESKEPLTKEKWEEERLGVIARMKKDKQRDALIAYLQQLRRNVGKEIKYDRGILKEQSSDKG